MSEEFKRLEETLGAAAMAQRDRAAAYLHTSPERLRTAPERVRAAIPRFIPIVKWLPAYQRTNLRYDLIAGLTVWGVGIPSAMAYAGIAGVPPEAGLYTALAAMTLYAVFSSSRHVKVTASSTMAVMSAAVIAPLAGGDATTFWALTSALALTVGVMLLIAGIIRLGFIADFLSKPVVTGFVFGLAITIGVGQLPKLFGVPAGDGNVFQQMAFLISELGDANLATMAVSALTILLILLVRRNFRHIPSGLVALVFGILISSLLNLSSYGVSVVGEIPTGLPQFGLPGIPLSQLPFLIAGAGGIVFLAAGESLGSARAFAGKYHYALDGDQELIAMGMANLGSGLSQGMTADASLSISATGEASGSKTQLTALVAAGLVLLTLLFLTKLFAPLPNAVLGTIVIASVLGLMDYQELRRYREGRRTDFVLALVALFGVILSDVLVGLTIAVLLSLMIVLYRASRPYMATLGRVPGQRAAYGDLARHPENEEIPGLAIFRVDAPLFFANANVADKEIRNRIALREPTPQAIIIDLGATSDLDIASADMLTDLIGDLQSINIQVMLAQVRGAVRERMRKTGLMERVGQENIFLSVEGAVHAFQKAAAQETNSLEETSAIEPPPPNQDSTTS
jgi:high affinity sulfate transporter 1